MQLLLVSLAALGTALATGLGAVPFALVSGMSDRWIGTAAVLASGLMTGASIGLVYEGAIRNFWLMLVGALIGCIVIVITRKLLAGRERDLEIGQIKGAGALKVVLIVAVMTVHSFTEGVAVGVSFAGPHGFGWAVAIAIAVHNIPEGLAISLVVISGGGTWLEAAGWSIFSSLPQPIMAIPSYLGVKTLHSLLPAGLGFAAGAMLWMVTTQLIPEARQTVPLGRMMAVLTVSAAAILAFGAVLTR
jgi:zinc transporter ZupT